MILCLFLKYDFCVGNDGEWRGIRPGERGWQTGQGGSFGDVKMNGDMNREGRRGDKDGSEPLAAELNGGFAPALIAVSFP